MKYNSFREYYKNVILKESPLRGQLYLPNDPDNININIEWTKDILQKAKQEDILKYFGTSYYVFLDQYDDNLDFYVLNDNKAYIIAYLFFKKNEYGYTITAMWKTKTSPLKIKTILLDYFLPKLKWIFSASDNITNLGEKFWKDFISSLDNTIYETGIVKDGNIIIKTDTEFINSEDIWNSDDQIWIKIKG
jgi:hypothetical protein